MSSNNYNRRSPEEHCTNTHSTQYITYTAIFASILKIQLHIHSDYVYSNLHRSHSDLPWNLQRSTVIDAKSKNLNHYFAKSYCFPLNYRKTKLFHASRTTFTQNTLKMTLKFIIFSQKIEKKLPFWTEIQRFYTYIFESAYSNHTANHIF